MLHLTRTAQKRYGHGRELIRGDVIPLLSTTTIYYERDCESDMACNFAGCLRPTFVIVMDKPLLDSSPQEANTGSYSRSLRASSTLKNIRRENFQSLQKL